MVDKELFKEVKLETKEQDIFDMKIQPVSLTASKNTQSEVKTLPDIFLKQRKEN